ncbi:alpha-amylase family glycosyl hydrolase [Paenibacillus soyae]|uniref:pullulanase n=1 Tax=Paenibacillus soyae TaxID=2969249 RepID=A0A9X2N0K5_9BACL|nr:alpha-amylase family glycosyl hydrolase [Paenibacillus soyae]MCR2806907.1 alpha-amylase family glycosyl hydrolase [Paenibacillus soyae]
MVRFKRFRQQMAIALAAALTWTTMGIAPVRADEEAPSRVTLVGSLQTELGAASDWEPKESATDMTSLGGGNYSFKGTLQAGTYEYKVALNGTWDENYGHGSYTKPDATSNNGNIVLTLEEAADVTFYYNHATKKIADSTYYAPLGTAELPRVVGSLQSEISESDDWSPSASSLIMSDDDYDNVYTMTANVPEGNYEYKVVLGNSWDHQAYPGSNAVLSLPQELPVTFSYNKATNEVKSEFIVPAPTDPVPDGHLRIHYNRPAGDYDAFGLWLWEHVAAPSTGWPGGATAFPADKRDNYGAYIDVKLADNASKVGFLVLNLSTEAKDGGDKSVILTSPDMNEIWIKQGDDKVYSSPSGEVAKALLSAEIVSDNGLLLGFTTTEGLNTDVVLKDVTVVDSEGEPLAIQTAAVTSGTSVSLTLTANIDMARVPLAVQYNGIDIAANVGWRLIDSKYAYNGNDLGATYADGGVTLKLWAPKASKVTAKFYDKDDTAILVGSVELALGDDGVWSAKAGPANMSTEGIEDLRGYYYQYEVTNDGVTKKVLDPYAKSMAEFRVNTAGEAGPDGDTVGKAAIVDLSGTDPAGFGYAQIDGYEKREDAVIWEAHIRDFTSDPSIDGDLTARFGTYKAFIDKLPYIQSLGVTHIQLLPVMAWYYGDELAMDERQMEYSAVGNEYNWGYDPHSYFSPDGAYSENAMDPELRVRELKELIDAIHEAGMGVVLDVVYTHMAKADFLNDIVPNYYAFQDASGKFLGDFGNNLATNRAMAEKLMVDSVKYWFDEYKIDGMRWDMMGDASYPAVQKAYDEAVSINPDALFIGEGWRTFKGNLSDPSLAGMAADQDWMNKTDSVGVFSDEIRNELKSGYGSEGEPRFITGGARDIQTILNNIKGQPSNVNEDDPGDIVPYIEAHDNLPLYDVIAQSIKKDPAIAENNLEIHKRIRLGNLIMMTSQGTSFLHAGQEYGRTKQWLAEGVPEQKYHALEDENGEVFGYFVHDSYDSSDAINKFDWAKATDEAAYPVNHVTSEYTKGLIALRKSTDAFRLGDQDLVNSNVTLLDAPEIKASDLLIGYKNVAMDGSGHYYVFINADDESRMLTLKEDLTEGTVVVDNDEAGTTAVLSASGFTLTDSSITIDPLSAVIIRMDADAPEMVSIETDDSERELKVNETSTISVYAKYEGGSREKVRSGASFESSNSKVASVSSSGKITALGVGHAQITVKYAGFSAIVEVEVQEAAAARVVQFNYIRPDGNYTDWNIWVWGTGVKDGEILFDKIENGVATAMIDVHEDAVSVGFVLRKGTDWATAKKDIGYDRVIPLGDGDQYTKVNVHSMVGELDLFPSIDGPYLLDGDITFRYRDESLFRQGLMDTITGVQVKIDGQSYLMVYDEEKEWYEYTLENVEPDSYEYSFLVTRDGETIERNDPTNTQDGKSVISYQEPEVTLSGSVEPGAIHYEESAVLRVSAQTSEPLSFREGYMDLTALGGAANSPFNTELMAHTISVKENVTAGVKSIPVTLVDEYGNSHSHTVNVTVKPRTFAGELDFDYDESRIYFLLTDRFEDGDKTNNENVDKTHPEAYHGGDFKGLISKLPYLDELGINTIWITPIVDNIDFNKGVDFKVKSKQYGYTGYWAKDFTQLDEHLGDMDMFKKLIEDAHDLGIKVMVDVVVNHTGYGLKPNDNYEGVTEADKERFEGMLRTNGLSADVNPTKGELQSLPDLMTENAEVREQIIEWQTGWLEWAKTERGDTIDYFRVDTVKHVETTTWVAFKNALTKLDPSFKLMGEYFGGTVESDGGMLDSGQMDALLDFGFKERARDFANGSIDEVDAYLQDRESKLSNTKTMGQFLSSHDENGFLSHYVGGDKSKLMIAAALQITAKGMPVIYYGEELGQSGANAGDMNEGQFSQNRDDMPWDQLDEEAQLHGHYKKLLNIRANYSKVYAKGERTKLAGSDEHGYLAFNKSYNNENIVTIINTKNEAVSVTLDAPFAPGTKVEDEYSGRTYTVSADGKLAVQVPSRSGGGTVILSDDVTPPVITVPGGTTPTPQWPGAETVTSGELASGKDGKAAVELKAGATGAVLPIQAASLLGGNNLEIVTDGITITLPKEALVAAADLVPANERTSDTFILFQAKPLSEEELKAAFDGYESEGILIKQGGTVYDFRIAVMKGGKEVGAVSEFEEPVSIAFEVPDGMNEDTTGIYYIGEEGELIYVGGWLQDGVMTAELSHFSAYGVLEIDRSFSDLPTGHWAAAAVKSLAAKGIVDGMDGQRFAPDADVTRAQFAKMLVSALLPGMEPAGAEGAFTDVPADAWFAPYAEAAYELGIVNGRGDGRFAPEEAITREEMAAMLIRAYRLVGEAQEESAPAPAFTDFDAVSSWALQDVSAAAELELVKGRADGSFAPGERLSRAESAQAVYNLLKAIQ